MKEPIDTSDVVHFEEALTTPYESGLPVGQARLVKTTIVHPWQESIHLSDLDLPKGVRVIISEPVSSAP